MIEEPFLQGICLLPGGQTENCTFFFYFIYYFEKIALSNTEKSYVFWTTLENINIIIIF